ncbi:cell division cycle-associated protein 7-like isoform X3 [Ananas comosus]|uniref:Cell division cycle-associated protein 7-like isoform X3 n=1 Tax=Ananas comosus TaxID=4615 RepID=A0A6P5G2I6_ANACO|nr:cell division cycle-associated protein 7-like isoform X3 [Ananas comosus]
MRLREPPQRPNLRQQDYTNTPERTKKARKIEATPLRRSDRVKKPSDVEANSAPPLRRSDRLKGKSPDPVELTPQGGREVVVSEVERRQLLSRRCDSKGRGSVYDPVLGICCHFCRQKKLCGEEDCRRCGDRDSDQPCIGKTECSSCHSANGVLCRACLKVRYGEDMEEVRMKKDWTCPHCIEEKGLNKFWICNSSLCLKKRKMAPTGIAIYQAREQGYKSVAHLLMAKLKENALQ